MYGAAMTTTEQVHCLTIAELVDLSVQVALLAGDSTIGSHELAKRLGAPVTYVQHCLREAHFVCRYSDDLGRYRIHATPECGPRCQEHATHITLPLTPVCRHCFLHIARNGTCGCDL